MGDMGWESMLTVEEKLETLGASILNELCSFTNTCSKDELNYLKNIIPEITLFDIATGTKYIVHGNVTEDFGYELEFPDSLDSSTSNKRVLMVYLSDGRLRKELMLNYALQSISKERLDIAPRILLPSTPDLVIVTGKLTKTLFKHTGLHMQSGQLSRLISPLIYSKQGRFGFNQFSRSIFSYISNNSTSVLSTEKTESATCIENGPDADSLATTNKSISSYVSFQSSQYLTNLFKRVKGLTTFGTTSDKEVALED